MDPKLIWLVLLIILSLVQILYMLVKFFTNRKEKTDIASDAPDNPGYGERIATLEGQMRAFITNNEKDHGLIRKDISKLFTLLEEIRK